MLENPAAFNRVLKLFVDRLSHAHRARRQVSAVPNAAIAQMRLRATYGEDISQKVLNGWPVFSTKIPPAQLDRDTGVRMHAPVYRFYGATP